MKRNLSLLVALALGSGLVAASVTTATAAPVKASSTLGTSVAAFKFATGKFTGKLEADRRLCLQNNSRDPRTVTIYKKVDGKNVEVVDAKLDMSSWSTIEGAKFSVAHPGMKITNRRKRLAAVNGTYLLKLEAMSKMEYSKSFSCAAASDTLTVKL